MSTQYFHDIPIPKTFDCLFFLKKMNQFRKMIDTPDYFLFLKCITIHLKLCFIFLIKKLRLNGDDNIIGP